MRIVHQNISEAEDRSHSMGNMFTGKVLMQQIVTERDAPSLRVTSVTFADGCQNTWHTHTTEQVLVVTHGVGIVAVNDRKHEIVEGDVVLIQPNERHWHGAKKGHDMTHLSILVPGEMNIEANAE